MSTALTYIENATYEFQTSGGSKYARINKDISLPATLDVSPSGAAVISSRKAFVFEFELPERLKYKKVLARLRWNFDVVKPNGFKSWVYIGLTSTYNTQASILDEVLPIDMNRIFNAIPVNVDDDNINTNLSHACYKAATYRTYDDNGNQNSFTNFTLYTGPSNKLLGQIIPACSQKPATWDVPTQYSTNQVTLNSLTLEIADDELCEDYIILTPTYPVDVNIKNTSNTIFTWDKETNVQLDLGQEKFNTPILKKGIQYKISGSSQTNEVVENGSSNYVEVEANTFGVENYLYKPILYDTYNNVITNNAEYAFRAIGQDAAPTINSVTNENIPTVAWSDTNQDAFIIRVKDQTQKIIFDSGIVAGNAQSFEIPKMLENGTYIVEVKELNTFGYFSEWGSLEFTLAPEEVDPPTNIFAFVNNQYGVEIQGIPAEDAAKTFVVRKEKDSNEVEIIGEYTGTPFIDYSTKGGVFYEYTLRNYNEGYKDGEWVPLQTKIKEIIIQDGRDLSKFIELYMTGNSNFAPDWIEEVDRTLYNCLGRKYPVKEPGEWINAERSFTAHIKEEKWPQLYDMAINAPKVYYKAKGEYFACDMQIEDAGRYIGGGRMVKFNLTRIDDKGISIL